MFIVVITLSPGEAMLFDKIEESGYQGNLFIGELSRRLQYRCIVQYELYQRQFVVRIFTEDKRYLSYGVGQSKRDAIDQAGKVAVVKLASENEKARLMILKICAEADRDPSMQEKKPQEMSMLLAKRAQPEENIFKQYEYSKSNSESYYSGVDKVKSSKDNTILTMFEDINEFYMTFTSFCAKQKISLQEIPISDNDGVKHLTIEFAGVMIQGKALTKKDV